VGLSLREFACGHKIEVMAHRVLIHGIRPLLKDPEEGRGGDESLSKAFPPGGQGSPGGFGNQSMFGAAPAGGAGGAGGVGAPTNPAGRARWVPPGTRKLWNDRIMEKGSDGRWHMIGRAKGNKVASKHGLRTAGDHAGDRGPVGGVKEPEASGHPTGSNGAAASGQGSPKPPKPQHPPNHQFSREELRDLLLQFLRVHKAHQAVKAAKSAK
jgi:hypothetical protein